MHHPRHLQPPPHQKFLNFISSLHIEKSSIVSLSWPSFTAILFVLGWLVDNQLVAAHTKSPKFLEISKKHHFIAFCL